MTVTDTRSGVPSLAELCARARGELASLGDLGTTLVATLGVVEQAGTDRGVDALADPTFAIDVLTVAGPRTDPVVLGRVLDFLRARHGTTGSAHLAGPTAVTVPPVTLTDAIASYEAGPLALMAKGTSHTYRTWTRRLAEAYGARSPQAVTAGDLKDLVHRRVNYSDVI